LKQCKLTESGSRRLRAWQGQSHLTLISFESGFTFIDYLQDPAAMAFANSKANDFVRGLFDDAPMLSVAPIAVPTRLSCGCSGASGLGGGGGTTATAADSGRRDGENSGRSRVADIASRGIPHNGFLQYLLTAG
jgi:hypothetical protein